MLWTSDPLVARNAHFNINRLGALPVEYVENIYGANTGSTLHGALPTDRTVIAWQLSKVHAPVPGAARERPGDATLPPCTEAIKVWPVKLEGGRVFLDLG